MDAVQGCMERDADYVVMTETFDRVWLWNYIVGIDGVSSKENFFCMSLSRRRVEIDGTC